MAYIDVRSLNINPSGSGTVVPGSTSFFDSFSRATGPIGSNWVYGAYGVQPPFTNPIQGPFPWIQLGSTRNCMNWILDNNVGVGQQWITWAAPIQTMLALRTNKSQFSQVTFDSGASNSVVGLTVVMSGSQGQGYLCETEMIPGGGTKLYSVASGGGTPWVINFGLLGTASASPLNPGDILRLSADLSNPSQVTLTVHINGALALTVIDAVSNYRTGFPGMMSIGQFTNTGTMFFRDFSCGSGL
jgi:hypothetical protein